jgi:hypothetical protein
VLKVLPVEEFVSKNSTLRPIECGLIYIKTFLTVPSKKLKLAERFIIMRVVLSSLFEKVSSLWQNYCRRNANVLEIENLAAHEFENLAADLGIEPGDLRVLCSPGENMKNVLDYRFKQFGISRNALDFAALAEMHFSCRFCAHKRLCKYDVKHGRLDSPCPFDCPNLERFRKLHAAA